jgi:hypothetical protein
VPELKQKKPTTVEVKRMSLVKPTLQTHYHIDFDWWRNSDRDWHVYLQGFLCNIHQPLFSDFENVGMIDWIDPETAEVSQVDGLQHVLISHCTKQPEFISQQLPLVDSVFRLLLANGNTPMTAVELGDQLGKDPNLILRTISGLRVYKGIRPVIE